ncbi:MAG: phosphate signaling complex protein PhoU [FCB group bacterium]|nr:phosphate signaling complex protein PhoU [FCB group bacterium]
MSKHFQRQIERLKKKMLFLSAVVEESVHQAVTALIERDIEKAVLVIKKDEEIDNMEVELEEEGLKILALYQPVAIDLRFIIAVLKINNDLERIGDLSVNIAERAVALASVPPVEIFFDIEKMSTIAKKMLKKSLDALVNLDVRLASEIESFDDDIDRLHRGNYAKFKEAINANPNRVDELLQLLGISRYLERIADHTTNIAEDVIYMVDGNIVRHKNEL